MDEDLSGYLAGEFERLRAEKQENFGNARTVRNVFEKAIANHANRVATLEDPDKHTLELLTKEDIAAAIERAHHACQVDDDQSHYLCRRRTDRGGAKSL
jgi:citrate lyase gamma subunit